jgi:hypothetical protein
MVYSSCVAFIAYYAFQLSNKPLKVFPFVHSLKTTSPTNLGLAGYWPHNRRLEPNNNFHAVKKLGLKNYTQQQATS